MSHSKLELENILLYATGKILTFFCCEEGVYDDVVCRAVECRIVGLGW